MSKQNKLYCNDCGNVVVFPVWDESTFEYECNICESHDLDVIEE